MRRLVVLVLFVAFGAVSPIAAQPEATPPGATPVPASSTPGLDATPVLGEGQPAWLELGAGDAVIARAIAASDCPVISIDDTAYRMAVRATATEHHPNMVCETVVPEGSTTVTIGETSLPMPKANPERVLVVGDTGCRLKSEDDEFQACNDPDAWPLAKLATQAAAWKPDLIIHVGDYLYRESPCPDGNAGCAGSPWGDTWATWEADFFEPASPLLGAAPWIFVRGNHEDCERAGDGWFRYLDPRPLAVSCLDFTEPYALTIGSVEAVVLDSAAAGDTSSDDATTEAYRAQFAAAERLAGDGPAWLLTHRPFWSIADGDEPGTFVEWTTATYTDAGYLQPPAAFRMVIAGHVHMGQMLTFTAESGRPLELIAGNSGTQLEMENGVFTGRDVGDDTLVSGWRWAEFGFIGIEHVDTGWVATMHLLDGRTPLSCFVTGSGSACVP